MREPPLPGAHVALHLTAVVIGEPERELLELPGMALELLAHALALAHERLVQQRAFAAPALAELLRRLGRELLCPALELRKKLGNIRRAGSQQPVRNGIRRLVRAVAERVVEQSQAAPLGLARVCLERTVSTIRLGPPCGDCDQLLVQALAPRPYSDTRPSRMTRGMESDTWTRQAREMSL